jgi:hypothetical protein
MEVRLKKNHELIGFTEEIKAGVNRTLAAGPLQKGIGLIPYDVLFFMHPTRIEGEIFCGFAILANSKEHAEMLPGYKPYGAPGQKTVIASKRAEAGEDLFSA